MAQMIQSGFKHDWNRVKEIVAQTGKVIRPKSYSKKVSGKTST